MPLRKKKPLTGGRRARKNYKEAKRKLKKTPTASKARNKATADAYFGGDSIRTARKRGNAAAKAARGPRRKAEKAYKTAKSKRDLSKGRKQAIARVIGKSMSKSFKSGKSKGATVKVKGSSRINPELLKVSKNPIGAAAAKAGRINKKRSAAQKAALKKAQKASARARKSAGKGIRKLRKRMRR